MGDRLLSYATSAEVPTTSCPVRSRGEALLSRVGSPPLISFVDIYFYVYHMIQLSFFCKAEARLGAFLLFRGPTVSLHTPKRKEKKNTTVPEVSMVT